MLSRVMMIFVSHTVTYKCQDSPMTKFARRIEALKKERGLNTSAIESEAGASQFCRLIR